MGFITLGLLGWLDRTQLLVKDPHQNSLANLGGGLAALVRVFVSVKSPEDGLTILLDIAEPRA